MLNIKETISILVVTLILALIISLIESLTIFIYFFLMVFFVIAINTISKKITSYYLDSKIEIKIWEIKRWGLRPKMHFNKPFLIGSITYAFLWTG